MTQTRTPHTLSPSRSSGFILPAVIMLSAAIIVVSAASAQLIGANLKASVSQNNDLIANEAALAGIHAAKACVASGVSEWTELTPHTRCDGTTAGTAYIVRTGNTESTYSVSQPQDTGSSLVITSVGTVTQFSDITTRTVAGTWSSTSKLTYRKTSTPSGNVSKPIADITTGLNHACAVAESKVYCWGRNDRGQLGDTTRSAHASPVVVGTNTAIIPADPGDCAFSLLGNCVTWNRQPMPAVPISALLGRTVTKVAAGPGDHTCAIADGKAYCWGRNDRGQLGNRTTLDSYTPTAVYDNPTAIPADPGQCGTSVFGVCLNWTRPPTDAVPASPLAGKTVTDISVGYDYTCAVANGSVICWGNNDRGQLGTNDRTQVAAPTSVYTRPYTPAVVGVCKSSFFGVCLNWDPPASAAVDASVMYGKTIVKVSAGSDHSCAFDNTNVMYCWGKNEGGQLGNGAAAPPTSGSDSSYSSSWSLDDGCSGSMSSPPQRGPDPNTTDVLQPVAVHVKPAYSYTTWWGSTVNVPASTLYNKTIQDIRASGDYTSVLADNRVYWFGGADATSATHSSYTWVSCTDKTPNGCTTGQSGCTSKTVQKYVPIWWREWAYHMTSVPTGPVYNTQTFFGIAISGSNNALTNKTLAQTSGAIFGDDSCGTYFGLGNSCSDGASQGTFCALTTGNELYCDGPEYYLYYRGNLGDGVRGSGYFEQRFVPGPVRVKQDGALAGKTITKLISNPRGDYSCVVADQALYCWGNNYQGRLGVGDTTSRYEPTPLDISGALGNSGGSTSETFTDPVIY